MRPTNLGNAKIGAARVIEISVPSALLSGSPEITAEFWTGPQAAPTFELQKTVAPEDVDQAEGLALLRLDAADWSGHPGVYSSLVLKVTVGDVVLPLYSLTAIPEPDWGSLSISTYISVQDVRNEGLGDEYTDGKIAAAIVLWQQFIERATRQWFEPRQLEFSVDGTDSDTIFFGVPVIELEEVRLNDSPDVLESRFYRVHNAREYPHDRQNPHIRLIDNRFAELDIYTAPLRAGRLLFRKGAKNQHFKGVFGYVEPDGSTPALIKRALTKLVVEKIRPLVPEAGGVAPPALLGGLITEEWTDGHRLKYAQSGGALKPRAPGLAGITDDPEVLRILQLYRAPLGVATPANVSYR